MESRESSKMAVCLVRSVFSKQLNAVRLGLFGLARLQRIHTDDSFGKETSNSSSLYVQYQLISDEFEEVFNLRKDISSSESSSETKTDPVEHEESQAQDTEAEDIETQILRASLNFVPEFGWSSNSISAGAETLGLSSMVKEMFPRGGGDLALFYIEDCNIRLADYLVENSKKEEEDKDAPKRRPSVIVRDAVEVRLRMIIPYIDSWTQVMRLMAMPQNGPDALKSVAYMVDDIWYHAGDTSTDINWYSKRATLAALYGATELYMVQDCSDDFQNTWAFLDNRLDEIKQLAKMKESLEKTSADTAQLLFAALTTMRNMAGFNKRSR